MRYQTGSVSSNCVEHLAGLLPGQAASNRKKPGTAVVDCIFGVALDVDRIWSLNSVQFNHSMSSRTGIIPRISLISVTGPLLLIF